MLGAIAGDIIGSPYERWGIKTVDFPLFSPGCRFTDDTVLTVALADSILTPAEYRLKLKEYYAWYPRAGYGGSFIRWANSEDMTPYNSWGNGSAMRVSPVGLAYNTLEEVLKKAKESAEITHNHPEGIKGACATASAIFMAKTGKSKEEIKDFIQEVFKYDLSVPLDEIREDYDFDVSCQGSVPQAIICFLESSDFESAVRNAVSLGGDADTQACISGAIAHAFYKKIPAFIEEKTLSLLDERLKKIALEFMTRFPL